MFIPLYIYKYSQGFVTPRLCRISEPSTATLNKSIGRIELMWFYQLSHEIVELIHELFEDFIIKKITLVFQAYSQLLKHCFCWSLVLNKPHKLLGKLTSFAFKLVQPNWVLKQKWVENPEGKDNLLVFSIVFLNIVFHYCMHLGWTSHVFNALVTLWSFIV